MIPELIGLDAIVPRARARVVDWEQMEVRGKVINVNDWSREAIGWTAIQICKWAMLPKWRHLEALREATK